MKHNNIDLKKGIDYLSHVDKRLSLSFGVLILALMMSVLIANGLYLKGVMDREESQLTTLLTQVLATSVSRVSFSGRYHAQLFIEETQKEYPDIKYLHITDLKGRVLASSLKYTISSFLTGESGQVVNDILDNKYLEKTRKTTFTNDHIIEISLPYHGGFDNTVQGVIQIGLSQQTKDKEIKRGIILISIMVALLLFSGILLVRKLSLYFGNPIQQLASDMAATLQAIPDLLFELDLNGRYLQVMAHKDELLTDTRERLLGKTVNEIFHKDAADQVLLALKEANDKGESHGRQYSLPLPHGTLWFELSVARKVTTDSKLAHFIVLSRNITERKKAEDELISHRLHLEELVQQRTAEMEAARDIAEQASMAKSEFLSRMSHELRTPMNAILGFGQLLELENLTQDQQSHVMEILHAGHHLLHLINEVLDLAKIESGKLNLNLEAVPVDELIKQSISFVQPQLTQRNLKLTNETDNSEWLVMADPIRLKQVLLNLLSNAVKYNYDNGNVLITSKLTGDQRLRLYVTSTGDKLTPEQVEKLFTPFERLNTKNSIEGTGIGLVISKFLVEAMGGDIGVQSDEYKGNTFWIELNLTVK